MLPELPVHLQPKKIRSARSEKHAAARSERISVFKLGLFSNKLSGSIEYFGRKSSDMLYNKPVAPIAGYSSIPMNIGSMRNTGLEIDLNYNICGDDFEGEGNVWGGHNQKNHDHWFTAEVGLTYSLGKTNWDPVPDVDAIKQLSQAQLDALNAQLADANAEIERLRNQPAPEPVETIVTQSVKDFITTPISVFFNLNKTEIAVLKDLVNVKALAKFAIENDRSILVTGYADSATGTPEHNMWLSDKRAERVKNELINMGVKPEKITTAHFGGVEILTPIDFNRRATVQITEE